MKRYKNYQRSGWKNNWKFEKILFPLVSKYLLYILAAIFVSVYLNYSLSFENIIFASLVLVIVLFHSRKGFLIFLIFGGAFFVILYFLLPLIYQSLNYSERQEYYVWDSKEKYAILYGKGNKYLYYTKEKLEWNSYITGTPSFDNIDQPKNASSFDFRAYMYSKNVFQEAIFNEPIRIQSGPKLLRGRAADFISQINNKKAGSFFGLLLFNLKNNDDSFLTTTKELSIIHIIVISGLHLNLISYFIYWIVFKITKNKRISLVTAFMVILLYSATLNFSLSTLRVLIYSFLTLLVVNKKIKNYHVLGLSFVLNCFIFPYAPINPTFLLSYGVSFFLMKHGRMYLKKEAKLFKVITNYLFILLVANVAALPFIIYINYEFNIISWMVQLIMAPFFIVLYPLLFLALFIQETHFIVGQAYDALNNFLKIFNLASINLIFGKLSIWLLFLSVLIGYFTLKRESRGYVVLKILFYTLYWVIVYYKGALNPFFQIDFINVGNALSVLITLPFLKGAVLYDAPRIRNLSQREVIPFLKAKGIRKLDYIFLSHHDADHIGGEEDIEKAIEVRQKIYYEDRFQELQLYDLNMKNLNSMYKSAWSDNNQSIVLLMEYKGISVLLTGDIEKKVEEILCKTIEDKRRNIALIPHHGSSTSSSECFVKAVRANYAVASNGKIYNNPKDYIRNRWEKEKSTLLETKKGGTISFYFSPSISFYTKYYQENWPVFIK